LGSSFFFNILKLIISGESINNIDMST
jgi:hypothetical protein